MVCIEQTVKNLAKASGKACMTINESLLNAAENGSKKVLGISRQLAGLVLEGGELERFGGTSKACLNRGRGRWGDGGNDWGY